MILIKKTNMMSEFGMERHKHTNTNVRQRQKKQFSSNLRIFNIASD